MTKYFLILFLLFNYSLSSEEKPNTFQVTNLESPVSLDSNENQDSAWYVFTGELTESEIKKQSLALFDKSLWKTVKVPGNIAKEAPEFQGKKNILLAKWIRMPKDNQGNISIRLGVINDRDKFYWNGVKIAETGKWDALEPQSYDRIRLYPIPNQLINYGETNLIMVHIQPYFDYTVGVEQDSTSLGKSSQMMKKFYFEEFTKLLFLVVYLTVGGYFLFLFIRRRRESENLFFALFSIGLVFYNLLRNQIKYEFGIPFLYMKKVEYMILLTLIPFMFHFIRKLFDFKYLLLFKIIDGLQICFFLFFLITSNIEINNWMMNK
ncbi:MAG: 7TM diverse intracellular signaling domain-containing protein, partial [Nanoarchaeota archaeon]